MYDGPVREGTRGGAGEFRWTAVKDDKDRENYLGHTVNAPVGRWQKHKDIHWYTRDKQDLDAERAAEERKAELKQIKKQEEEAIATALGHAPKKKKEEGDPEGSGANAVPVGGSRQVEIDRLEKEERKREKALRKEQRALERVKREVKREEKDHHREERRSFQRDDDRRHDDRDHRDDCRSDRRHDERRSDRDGRPADLDRDRSRAHRPDGRGFDQSKESDPHRDRVARDQRASRESRTPPGRRETSRSPPYWRRDPSRSPRRHPRDANNIFRDDGRASHNEVKVER